MGKTIQRFNEIIKVLTKHGFGYIINTKIKKDNSAPRNLREACEELGPTFIKIGQIASTRPDILPEEYINELSKLQDNVKTEAFEDINSVFFNEFHKNIDDVFFKFNKIPLASGSISQVHEAVLDNGKKVIVKIQRPFIKEKMKLDFSILSKILSLTKVTFLDSLIDPREALLELQKATKIELNFSIERNSIKKFKKLNSDVKCIYVPYVIDELSGETIITMENVCGIKINDYKTLKQNNYDLNDIVKKLALSYFKQVFTDGFFHADPHPGNIIIRDGKICFIDFGIMGELDTDLKESLNDMLLAIAYNDINKMISVAFSIGIKKGHIDRNKLYEDIDYIFASYVNTSLQNIKISVMLQEIFDACKNNNIQLPKTLTLLIRSMIIIEGVISDISPNIKIIDIAIPFVKNNNKYNFIKSLDLDNLLIDSYKFLDSIKKIPNKTLDVMDAILTGRAKLRFAVKGLDTSLFEINKMINRIVFALIISSMIIGSSLILTSNIGPKLDNMSIIGLFGFFLAAIMGFWLVISMLHSGSM